MTGSGASQVDRRGWNLIYFPPMKLYGIAALAIVQALTGPKAIEEIRRLEGGEQFLQQFLGDAQWVEEFAFSGPVNTIPWRKPAEETLAAYKADEAVRCIAALKTLCKIVARDTSGAIATTKPLRNAATALVLNHATDFSDEKIFAIMDCYAQWYREGTLIDAVEGYDTRQWREVMAFGQNAPLGVDSLKWIHDFANLPPPMYKDACWLCEYRPFNCFGASVQGPDYYTPWGKEMSIQELRYRVGGVCGALSKFASHAAASHGIRSFTAAQPGHCAFTLWDFKNDRWSIAYNVTAHSEPHFTLGGRGFAALEEQDDYFRRPERKSAERLRAEGKFAESMKTCKGNWQAAYEWWLALKAKEPAAVDEWKAYGEALRVCFANAPSQGWQIYAKYLNSARYGREYIESEVEKGLWAFREREVETVERAYFDELALDPISRLFGKDETMWKLLPMMLASQANTPSFYVQTVNWGSKVFMSTPANAERFLAAVRESVEKTGAKLDFAGMVVAASASEDVGMFREVFSMIDAVSPESLPKKTDRAWPEKDYGGDLLSPDGMVAMTSTCSWDRPLGYRSALERFDVDANFAFHTDKQDSPAAFVILPGDSEITGITVVNSASCPWRQPPVEIRVSEDGQNFDLVYRSEENKPEWRAAFDRPRKAKYVMVSREAKAKDEFFHLKKILVYGRKLY